MKMSLSDESSSIGGIFISIASVVGLICGIAISDCKPNLTRSCQVTPQACETICNSSGRGGTILVEFSSGLSGCPTSRQFICTCRRP